MQRIEDFLQEYFAARTEMDRSLGTLYQSIASRFLAPNYASFDPEKSVADSEAETIVSVQASDSQADVITCGWLGAGRRVRYHLSQVADSWQIASIEMECGICHGSGQRKSQGPVCRICKGKGWHLLGKMKGT